ncbi:MAG: hypothetical protein AAF551_15605, partial [Bacteroidota bacterium]
GNQTSLESFQDNKRKAFNGLALVIIHAEEESGKIKLVAKSRGLNSAEIEVTSE